MNGFDWKTFVTRLPQRIWFRLVVFIVGALVLAWIAVEFGYLLPDALAVDFGQNAALRILEILATSMLAVTTFSLTAMISAYSSAAAGTTPRATQLLVADHTSQNALSSFLGSFVFAIVGIIALSTDTFTEKGRSLLFLGTLVVIAIVVGTLLRWIYHLTHFGRVPDVIDRVEEAATSAMKAYAREPHLGGVAPQEIPADAVAVQSQAAGVLTGLAMEKLQHAGERDGAHVHVVARPGAPVGMGSVLAYVSGGMGPDAVAKVRGAFRVEKHRTYEQDPRLGVVALSEIGSRALSPALNDPGTAVEVLNALARVLGCVFVTERADGEARFPLVHVPAVSFGDLLEDGLRPLARDGAGTVEVGLRLQRVLGDLVGLASGAGDVEVLRAASRDAAARGVRVLADAGDVELVERAAAEVQGK
jgi:uncharacterized membrane protein